MHEGYCAGVGFTGAVSVEAGDAVDVYSLRKGFVEGAGPVPAVAKVVSTEKALPLTGIDFEGVVLGCGGNEGGTEFAQLGVTGFDDVGYPGSGFLFGRECNDGGVREDEALGTAVRHFEPIGISRGIAVVVAVGEVECLLRIGLDRRIDGGNGLEDIPAVGPIGE